MARPYSLYLCICLLGSFSSLKAQLDTNWLSEVAVIEKRSSDFAVGSQLYTIDSNQLISFQGQNLTELLQFESGIYLKYYSPGNLASTSFRGGNASHTALTWNGFNINSPLNGIFDLSLFPVQAFDEVSIQPGTSSALWGSGAIGGSIHLGHKPEFDKGLKINLGSEFGSFGFQQQNVGLSFSNKRFSNRIMFIRQAAVNNFEYTNPFTSETEEQRHNELNTWAVLSENHFRPNARNLISVNWWHQETDRDIPPSLFETTLSQQLDDIDRLTAEWVHDLKHGELKTRGAWFSERQWYLIPAADTSYYNNSQAFIGELEYQLELPKIVKLDLGFNQSSLQGDVQSYRSDPIWQHRQSVFAGLNREFFSKVRLSAMLRQEWVDSEAAPFAYTLGLSWSIFKELELKAQVSRVYRIPTLNDTYWSPGGNPNLQPEDGYAQELGLTWSKKKQHWNWTISATAFNRRVSNWILWQPNQGIWSPQNLIEVWSRGLESQSRLGWQNKKWILSLALRTNYVLSTNEKASSANDASVGKQLIYTPAYNGTASLSISYSRFTVRYNHSYTGYTYTASDHSQWLEPYQLANLYLAYVHRAKHYDGRLFFRINNIWNESYQVVRSRPMPGVNYSLGIILNLKFYKQL